MKAIFFDFGQTLVNSADGFRAAEKEAENKIYACFDPSRLPWDVFLAEYRKIRKEFHRNSNVSRLAIWRAVHEKFNNKPDLGRLQNYEKEYWEQVGALTYPFPETVEVLEKLSDRYKLALITNTQGQQSSGTHRIALFPRLEKFFEVIIVAGEGGLPPKPDPEPFRRCLQKMDLLAHEVVFVGDDWRIDICGARNAGIQPVWIQHNSVERNWPEVDPFEPVITRLDGLITLRFM